jgi:hypothetical protein
MKKVDLSKTLYQVTEEYPELIDILKNLGFAGAANPVMRHTHGKIMTLNAGIEKLGLDRESVVKKLKEAGFEVH